MNEHKVPVRSLIDHIKTATDVDPWAKEMVEELLKEQEPKLPIVHENSYGWKFYYCPNCKKEFYQNRKQAYCDRCGKAVKWDDNI